MMDAALVRGILKSFIDGNPEDFSAAERQMAVRWFEERIVMTSKNKGSRPQHQPRMEAAANAAKQAVASYEKGDLFNAKQYAMEALKNF